MKKITSLLLLVLPFLFLRGQGSSEYGSGIKLNLDPEGNKYMRIIAWNQVWMRHTDNNPGSAINGEAVRSSTDIGNRRLRMLAYAQFSERYKIVTHFGINNQTFINGGASGSGGTGGYGAGKKPGLFFHDAWNEYAVILPKKDRTFSLVVGGGLHYFMGVSRLTMGSTLNFMTLDAPIFNWPLIEASDQFARQMGVFAKGKAGKLEYRFAMNKPYATNNAPTDAPDDGRAVSADHNGNPKWAQTGYVEYQFLDQESNALPFKVGTYVGTKKVFNIGAGFYLNQDATRSSVAGKERKHDVSLFAVDAFLDMPFGNAVKKSAITAYGVFYSYDFGPNYLRNIGIMNVATADALFTGTPALAGAGNAQPTIGTGNIWYTQAGFLLPSGKEKPMARVQPFVAYTFKDFDRYVHSSSQFDIGANLFLDGHHTKITGQYSTRPVYTAIDQKPTSKGEFILQLHIYL